MERITVNEITIAKNPDTPLEQLLQMLTQNPSEELIRTIILHPKIKASHLASLANSYQNASLQKEIVKNPNTPIKTAIQLAQKYPEEFLENPAWSLWLLETPHFFENFNFSLLSLGAIYNIPWVKESIHCLLQKEFLPDIASNYQSFANILPIMLKNPIVRRIVAQDQSTPVKILETLYNDNDEGINSYLASNPNTPIQILRRVFEKNTQSIFHEIAKNPKATPEMLEKLSTNQSFWVRKQVAQHKNTSKKILEQLTQDKYSGVREALMQHPDFPISLLPILSNDTKTRIRGKVANHKDTPVEILEKLSTDPKDYVRCMVAKNPNTPSAVLRILSKERSTGVYVGVASNENTPVEILQTLRKEKNKKVREAAENTLKKLRKKRLETLAKTSVT